MRRPRARPCSAHRSRNRWPTPCETPTLAWSPAPTGRSRCDRRPPRRTCPGASFAGQQDTYLNVAGIDEVLDAVHRCWASLWTDRAVAYRAAQGIDGSGVALAVVVQRMVDAESAGVLFTADPVTGRRRQAVLDAARGLGDAVVSGAVDPDHFVVDTANRADPRPAAGRLGRRAGGQPDGRAGASAGVARRPGGERVRQPAGHRMGHGRRRHAVADAVPADHDAVSGPGARARRCPPTTPASTSASASRRACTGRSRRWASPPSG